MIKANYISNSDSILKIHTIRQEIGICKGCKKKSRLNFLETFDINVIYRSWKSYPFLNEKNYFIISSYYFSQIKSHVIYPSSSASMEVVLRVKTFATISAIVLRMKMKRFAHTKVISKEPQLSVQLIVNAIIWSLNAVQS